MRAIIAVSLAAMLAGCVTGRPLREIAIDSNRLAATTANEQTLLNVLRAKDRMPLHFTSFTALRGNISLEASVALGATLNEAKDVITTAADGSTSSVLTPGTDVVAPSVSGKLTSSPSFDLAVYDTQEFQQGISSPIKPQVISYYLGQGWPEDLMTALYVERVEIKVELVKQKNGVDEVSATSNFCIVNHPVSGQCDGSAQSGSFKKFLENTRMVSSKNKTDKKKLIPLANFGQGLALGDIEKLDGAKFDIDDEKGVPYVFRAAKSSPSVSFEWTNQKAFLSGLLGAFGSQADAQTAIIQSGKFDFEFTAFDDDTFDWTVWDTSVSSSNPTMLAVIKMSFVPRSTDSVIYFLGSYARYELAGADVYTIEDGKKVIDLDQGRPANAVISARHLGKVYSLRPAAPDQASPGLTTHRGGQAIAFVQQLVNLHKKAENLPSPSSIRLIQ